MIDYEDIKSGWLETPEDGKTKEFVITKDATKVMKTSAKTGKPYPSYEFQVEVNKESFKWSALIGTYRQMVKDAGTPVSLVGTRWKWTRLNNEYMVGFVKGGQK